MSWTVSLLFSNQFYIISVAPKKPHTVYTDCVTPIITGANSAKLARRLRRD